MKSLSPFSVRLTDGRLMITGKRGAEVRIKRATVYLVVPTMYLLLNKSVYILVQYYANRFSQTNFS